MNLLDLIFPKRCVSCGKVGKYFCKICTAKIKFITHQICPVCEKAAIDGVTHPRCKTRYTIDGLTAFFHYEGAIRQAVKLLKYRFVSDLAKEFIDLIPISSLHHINQNQSRRSGISRLDRGSSTSSGHDAVITHSSQTASGQSTTFIPIPLHPSRQKFRGFNQAEILSRLLATKLNIPMRADILKRVKKTIPQVEMKDRKKRLTNMEHVFAINQLPNNNQSRHSGIHDAVITHSLQTASGQSTILLFDDVFTTGATLRSAANILKRAGAKKVWGIVMAHG